MDGDRDIAARIVGEEQRELAFSEADGFPANSDDILLTVGNRLVTETAHGDGLPIDTLVNWIRDMRTAIRN